jgi:hypothetical protein
VRGRTHIDTHEPASFAHHPRRLDVDLAGTSGASLAGRFGTPAPGEAGAKNRPIGSRWYLARVTFRLTFRKNWEKYSWNYSFGEKFWRRFLGISRVGPAQRMVLAPFDFSGENPTLLSNSIQTRTWDELSLARRALTPSPPIRAPDGSSQVVPQYFMVGVNPA